ncbi:MAG TPA: spermidine/putrescine ABC transporter ATP-binding protein, partial [Firmicutes bacterium]|nr:spermidine/putrescine ABC transporter ATP-binding protein [Bacillota bacterium]
TFIYVTHDQEEALSMSDTIVVMKNGSIQQIGTPIDIYNEPKNPFVADFIGESNIISGVMIRDYFVKFAGCYFECVDRGFTDNEPVDVVVRPEDIKVVSEEESNLKGEVRAVTFKGVHYEMLVRNNSIRWKIQSTTMAPVGSRVGLLILPDDIHIMKKVTVK